MLTVTNSLVINHWSLSRLGWFLPSAVGRWGCGEGPYGWGCYYRTWKLFSIFSGAKYVGFRGELVLFFYYWGWGEEFWKGAGQGDDFSSFGRDPVVLADLEVLTPICWVLQCFGPGVNSVWAFDKAGGHGQTCDLGKTAWYFSKR